MASLCLMDKRDLRKRPTIGNRDLPCTCHLNTQATRYLSERGWLWSGSRNAGARRRLCYSQPEDGFPE